MFNAGSMFGHTNVKQEGFSVPIVQELAAMSLQTLPDRYIRSQEERPSSQNHDHKSSSSSSIISTIDMASFLDDNSKQNEMKKLALACQEWGFFHRMKGVVREVFHLPLEEKLKFPLQGANGYGQAFVASGDQKLDWSDIIHLCTQPPEKRNMALWPNNPSDFREIVDQYSAEIQRLGNTLLCLLRQSLGLQADGLIDIFEKLVQSIRVNYYPPCPDPDLAIGLSPHSDADAITILLQEDEKVGLQIRKEGEWSPVQLIPNALVVNIGDMIEVVSNGRYKSIEHRAVTSKYKDRISVAAFINPNKDAMIGPSAELIDELHPHQYRNFKNWDYLCNYFAAKLDGKKAIDFAKAEGC